VATVHRLDFLRIMGLVGIVSAVIAAGIAPVHSENACGVKPMRPGNATDLAEANFTRLNDCIEKLAATVQSLQTELSNTRAGLLRTASETKTTIGGLKFQCPDGYYVVGMNFNDQEGLGHGALWGPSGVCAKLNLGSKN
jgi:hypothetical protein